MLRKTPCGCIIAITHEKPATATEPARALVWTLVDCGDHPPRCAHKLAEWNLINKKTGQSIKEGCIPLTIEETKAVLEGLRAQSLLTEWMKTKFDITLGQSGLTEIQVVDMLVNDPSKLVPILEKFPETIQQNPHWVKVLIGMYRSIVFGMAGISRAKMGWKCARPESMTPEEEKATQEVVRKFREKMLGKVDKNGS